MRVKSIAWPLAIAARCSTSLLFWTQPAVRRGEPADLLFVVVAAWGWWQWLRGTQADGAALARALPRPPRRAGCSLPPRWPPGPLLGLLLQRYTDTDVPCWDALPTAGSVVGQWLLGRKYVENWPVWIARQRRQRRAVRLQGPVADGPAVRPLRRAGAGGLARLGAARRRHDGQGHRHRRRRKHRQEHPGLGPGRAHRRSDRPALRRRRRVPARVLRPRRAHAARRRTAGHRRRTAATHRPRSRPPRAGGRRHRAADDRRLQPAAVR